LNGVCKEVKTPKMSTDDDVLIILLKSMEEESKVNIKREIIRDTYY